MKNNILGASLFLLVFLAFNFHAFSGDGSFPKMSDCNLGLHLQTWMIHETDLGGQGEADTWQATIARNCEWIAGKGFNVVLLDAMDPEGGEYFFRSDVLKRNKYIEGRDPLGVFVRQAHKNGLIVYADISVLAWRLNKELTTSYGIGGNPLDRKNVRSVVATLLNKYNFDGIVEESFPPEYVSAIYKETRKHKKKYIHKFDDANGNADILMSEDYVGFLDSPERVRELEETGAEANNLGVFNSLLGHAKALGKPGWIKVAGRYGLPAGAARNVLLFRAVQFQSNGYFWMPDNEKDIKTVRNLDARLLSRQLNRFREPLEKKPVVNAIIAFSTDNESDLPFLFLDHAFGPVSNGLMLSGYDLRVSFKTLLPDADAYVIFAIGVVGEEEEFEYVDFPKETLPLLDGDKPVIVVCCGIGDSPNWKRVLSKCGIKKRGMSKLRTRRLDRTRFMGKEIPWNAYTIWEYPTITTPINPVDVSGRVLATGGGERGDALVIKKGKRFLINGNALHLQTSFIFNSLLKKTLHEPFYGYGAVGKRSAFFALSDTPLVVDLPYNRGDSIRVIRFGSNGAALSEKKKVYKKPFSTDLEKYELLIVEPVEAGGSIAGGAVKASPASSASSCGVFVKAESLSIPAYMTPGQRQLKKAKSWMYQIQEINADNAVKRLADSDYDMLVIEPTNTNKGEEAWDSRGAVRRLKAKRPDRLVMAYIDIGEAESYRIYWKKSWRPPGKNRLGRPNFIVTCDPDGWAENYPAAFWDRRWRGIIIDNKDSLLKMAIADGYDGIYMDWVEAYNNDAVRREALKAGINPKKAMVDFILSLRREAHKLDPEFIIISQNAPYLIDHDPRYINAIDAVAFEDIWFRGESDAEWNDKNGGDILNDDRGMWSTWSRVKQYRKYARAGKPVFTCDYCLDRKNARKVYRMSREAGFIPLVTRVSLSRMTATPPP